MIYRLNTPDERRNKRLLFFKDDVFCIAHKAIKDITCSLSLEELFCTADRFTNHLLVNEIDEEDFVDYEIDDFERECNDEQASFLVLTLVFVKLCALRKTNTLAADVAKALIHRCQSYEGFTDLLKKFDNAEKKQIATKRRINLFEYELKTIGNDFLDHQKEIEIINLYINEILDCDVDVIKGAIVSFSNFNKELNNLFVDQLNILSEGYTNKLEGKEVRKIEYNFNSPISNLVTHADEVNINKLGKNE